MLPTTPALPIAAFWLFLGISLLVVAAGKTSEVERVVIGVLLRLASQVGNRIGKDCTRPNGFGLRLSGQTTRLLFLKKHVSGSCSFREPIWPCVGKQPFPGQRAAGAVVPRFYRRMGRVQDRLF